MKQYSNLTIESDAKTQLIELRDLYGFESITIALKYALQAARDAKKIESMLGVGQ